MIFRTAKMICCTAAAALCCLSLLPVISQAAPYLVKDVNPGPAGSAFSQKFVSYPSPTAVGGALFFQADDGTNGSELWKSDGTEVGTVLVQNIWADTGGVFSSKPDQLTAGGSFLFFAASNREDPITLNADYELWRSDGTTAVSLDIYSGTTSSSPSQLTAMGSDVYLVATTATSGFEIFKANGSGVSLLKDIVTGTDGSAPAGLAVGHVGADRLFFTAQDASLDRELWMSDGTTGGTNVLLDINPTGSSSPRDFASFGGKVYFSADDGTNGRELWVTDGTPGGTSLVADTVAGGSGSPTWITPAGTDFFFLVFNGDDRELWKSDGTGGGTSMVATIDPRGYTSYSRHPWAFYNGNLYFAAYDATNGCELWRSDGTGGGTGIFTDLNPGSVGGNDSSFCPSDLTVADGLLYFAARHETAGSGREVWATDGTTTVIAAETPGWETNGPEGLTVVGSTLFFLAKGLDTGRELWALPTGDVVTKPNAPSGPGSGEAATLHTYMTGGSISLKGNPVQYRFSWGDGSDSGWLSAGTTDGNKSWAAPGTYTVTVEARDTVLGVTSQTASLPVVISITETVSQPVITGPDTVTTNIAAGYEVSGAASNYGDTVEYRIDWADGGGFSSWQDYTDPLSLTNTWTTAGSYPVTVEVRCKTHTAITNTNSLTVTVNDPPPAEEVTGLDLTGTWDGDIYTSYDYTVTAISTLGHTVEYTIGWGDGTSTSWTAINGATDRDTVSHSWSAPGNYQLSVTARCQADPDKTAAGTWWVNIVNPVAEIIDPVPTDPTGQTEVWRGYSATFTSGGAESTWGGDVVYDFDWGDNTYTLGVVPSPGNTVTASHTWSTTGSPYYIWVTARSVNDPTNVHATSGHLTISVVDPEEVNPPGVPGGQTFGAVGTSYSYTSDLAVSTKGHTLEYQFDWGDGTYSSWATSRTANNTWSTAGNPWQVRSRARCADHTEVVSSWSVPLDVIMLGGAGGELFVCKSGCTYTSIQSAVDIAADGNTINVGDGTYGEDIDFGGKDLAIVSLGGPGAATIDGTGTGPVVTVSAAAPTKTAHIEGFTVTGGSATKGGGIFVSGAQAAVHRSIVSGNSAVDGGGIYATASELVVSSSIISGNSASVDGGGIFLAGTSADIVNSTVAGNSADEFGGGLVNYTGSPSVLNSIFWGNRAGMEGDQIDVDSGSVTVEWSDVETASPASPRPGTGNIAADPKFLSPAAASAAPTTGGDYHLKAGSPCLDTGKSSGEPLLPVKDVDGEERPQYRVYDMGADEGTAPVATILANGQSGSLTIQRTEELTVTISLAPGTYLGSAADFWVLVRTPFKPPGDWYHFVPPKLWLPGDTVTYRGSAMKLGSYKVMERKLPPGKYIFYFGIDLNGNGQLDTRDLFYDSVNVTVTN